MEGSSKITEQWDHSSAGLEGPQRSQNHGSTARLGPYGAQAGSAEGTPQPRPPHFLPTASRPPPPHLQRCGPAGRRCGAPGRPRGAPGAAHPEPNALGAPGKGPEPNDSASAALSGAARVGEAALGPAEGGGGGSAGPGGPGCPRRRLTGRDGTGRGRAGRDKSTQRPLPARRDGARWRRDQSGGVVRGEGRGRRRAGLLGGVARGVTKRRWTGRLGVAKRGRGLRAEQRGAPGFTESAVFHLKSPLWALLLDPEGKLRHAAAILCLTNAVCPHETPCHPRDGATKGRVTFLVWTMAPHGPCHPDGDTQEMVNPWDSEVTPSDIPGMVTPGDGDIQGTMTPITPPPPVLVTHRQADAQRSVFNGR